MTPSYPHPRYRVVVQSARSHREMECASLDELRPVLAAQVRTRARDTLLLTGFSAVLLRVRDVPAFNRQGHIFGRRQQVQRLTIHAVSPRDKLLHVGELLAQHRKRLAQAYPVAWRKPKPFTPRSGPVPGTGKRRGSRWFRYIHTEAERRLNALVLAEEGEVAARPRRRKGLPNTWDEFERRPDTSWTAQRKGRKAWDR